MSLWASLVLPNSNRRHGAAYADALRGEGLPPRQSVPQFIGKDVVTLTLAL